MQILYVGAAAQITSCQILYLAPVKTQNVYFAPVKKANCKIHHQKNRPVYKLVCLAPAIAGAKYAYCYIFSFVIAANEPLRRSKLLLFVL